MNVDSMSFLAWPTEAISPDRRFRQRRERLILDLLDKFARSFPEVAYELIWESPTINAQAWRYRSVQYVRIYGGLVRYPKMTAPGLALMLAHETGHHLGGPPYDPDMPWISWQGQADYWAASEGMKRVFGLEARNLTMRGARQIRELHNEFEGGPHQDEPALSSECRRNIFVAGATGREVPDCAKKAFAQLCRE